MGTGDATVRGPGSGPSGGGDDWHAAGVRQIPIVERRARLARRHRVGPSNRAGSIEEATRSVVALHATHVSHAVLLGTTPPGPIVKPAEELFFTTAAREVNDFEDEVILFFEPRSPESRAAARRSGVNVKGAPSSTSRRSLC